MGLLTRGPRKRCKEQLATERDFSLVLAREEEEEQQQQEQEQEQEQEEGKNKINCNGM
jgi:hypothetical protein